MSRLLLIPVAVLLAAGAVVLGPGEQAPAAPSQTVVIPTGDIGIQPHQPLTGLYAPRMVHDVLVVEDEEDIAVPLMRTLEREGYDVSRVVGWRRGRGVRRRTRLRRS